jgi:hypothetical protein
MRFSALNFSEKPMATTAADVLINGLLDWGVDTVFGIPGDGVTWWKLSFAALLMEQKSQSSSRRIRYVS